jgi:hypothetical protein
LRGIFRNIRDNQRCSWVMQNHQKLPFVGFVGLYWFNQVVRLPAFGLM